VDVSIVAAEAEVWRGEADTVLARSPEGEFGILRGHIPFLAALVPSFVTVVSEGSRRTWLVPGGFLEASGTMDDYHVIVLVDDAEETGELGDAEAKERIENLKRRTLERAEDKRSDAELVASMAAT
jgi:F-type H+-transporting ATPase subunit epsilon